MAEPTKDGVVFVPIRTPFHMQQLREALEERKQLLSDHYWMTPPARRADMDKAMAALAEMCRLTYPRR